MWRFKAYIPYLNSFAESLPFPSASNKAKALLMLNPYKKNAVAILSKTLLSLLRFSSAVSKNKQKFFISTLPIP